MRVPATSQRRLGDQRRYFPDWTDRLLESGIELEADRNSYLAGGYAEEFGYGAQSDCSRGVRVLDGESPELCSEWRCQAGGTHPGYPLRAHPFASEFDATLAEPDTGVLAHHAFDYDPPVQGAHDATRHGTFVVVSRRPYKHDTARRAAIISARVTSALVSLRWALRRR
jgi:hypothetical protein